MEKLKADILLLTSEFSKESISKFLIREWKKYLATDGRKTKNNDYDRHKNVHFTNGSLQSINNNNGSSGQDILKQAGLIVITSIKDYEDFTELYLTNFDFLFIDPELNWTSNGLDEAYVLLKNMITDIYREKTLQVKFISPYLSQDNIINNIDNKYIEIAKSFPHICLLSGEDDHFLFQTYSPIHYKLIRNLEFTDKGVASNLEHKFRRSNHILINTLKDKSENTFDKAKKLCIDAFHSLRSHEDILDIDIDDLMLKIQAATREDEIIGIFESAYVKVYDLWNKVGSNTSVQVKKHRYSVCVLEDDKTYLELISDTLNDIFSDIYPTKSQISTYSLRKHYNELDELIQSYNIFYVDLLFLENDKWLPFNGLEVYNYIKTKNPYATVRIITNLPRDIIASLSENLYTDGIMNFRIPMSHVFTKSRGDEQLRSSLKDRVDEVISEASSNEQLRRRNEANYPSTAAGILEMKGVKNTILELINCNEEVFNNILARAFGLLDLYKDDELFIDTQGWNKGQLPSPNTFREGNWDLDKLIKHLINIFTHRLFVLYESETVLDIILDISAYEEKVSEKVSFQNFDATNYLSTRLGFGKDTIEDGRIQIKRESLFPHELKMLDTGQAYIAEHSLHLVSDTLNEWFLDVLKSYEGSMAIYTIMIAETSFVSPYFAGADDKEVLSNKDIKINNITVDYLLNFIKLLKKYIDKGSVKKCIKKMEELYEDLPDLKGIPSEVVGDVEALFEIV